MLAQSTIEQVKNIQDIIPIISEYVTIQKKGRNYLGLCPFHSEKTPSFTVSPEKQLWHCFGCHEGGNLITFIMKIDNLSFTETVKVLAQKLNIPIIEDAHSSLNHQEDEQRHLMQKILYETREYFCKALEVSIDKKKYITDRGIHEETLSEFRVGYAPENQAEWIASLIKRYGEELVLNAGVYLKNSQSVVRPKFYDRIMFPIIDYQDRTVGFGGRSLNNIDPNVPKYLNSSENALFQKRKILFGLNRAIKDVRKKGYCILMEGYMDVITAHQYGFKNAIGTMGTAVSTDQLQKLKRFTNYIIVAMDNDVAGQKSIEKSIPLFFQYGFEVKVLALDEKDPADELQKYGAKGFEEKLNSALPMLVYFYELAKKKYNPKVIENIPKILSAITIYLNYEKDPIIQQAYIRKIAKDLNVASELVVARLKKKQYTLKVSPFLTRKIVKNKYEEAEKYILFLISADPALRKKIQESLTADNFLTDLTKSLYQKIIASDQYEQHIVHELKEVSEKQLLSRLLIEGERGCYPQKTGNEWIECLESLQNYHKEKRKTQILEQITQLEKSGRDNEIEQLFLELEKLIHKS